MADYQDGKQTGHTPEHSPEYSSGHAHEYSPEYSHTQRAPLSLMLCGIALAVFVLVWWIGDSTGAFYGGFGCLLLVIIAFAFHHLKVVDLGDKLGIRFGPLPLFRRTVRYIDINTVEVGRTLLVDGWGIHFSIRGGWVWNLWGRECVVIRMRNGGTLRVGTDDAENLAEFLDKKSGY